MRNKTLYEAAKTFVISGVRFLASSLERGESIPYTIVKKHTFEGEGTLKTDYVRQPMFNLLVFTHMERIQSIPEYIACVRAMHEDPTISKQLDCPIGTWSVRLGMTPWEYLSHLLERQASQLPEKLEFNSGIFEKTYSDLESFFFNETIPCKTFSPLFNFDSDVDRLELEDGLHIRKVLRRELEELLDEAESFSRLSVFDLKYVVEFEYETKKKLGDMQAKRPQPDVDPWEKPLRLLAALRLFKQGNAYITTMKTAQTLDVHLLVSMTIGDMHQNYIGQKYELKEAELDDFKRFWNYYKEINLTGLDYLGVALRRFNYAYERGSLEDKLIDHLVAFEALFFKQGETGEFRHKLSMRVARFLEHEYDKRKVAAEKMADFYDKRSSIVHGEKVVLKPDDVITVEDYLRRSIRLFLERLQGSDHNSIISHLDLE